MSRFRCVGPACEASCCTSGWTITVDEKHHGLLEQAMSATAEDRARFRGAVRLETGPERSAERHALMVLDQRGGCRLLDPEGSCSVHRRFGEDVLPHVCAIYPRKMSLAHGRIELAGALSCPEVTRLLYAGADSTSVEPLDPTTLRNRVTQVCDDDSPDPYDQVLDDVRAIVVDLLETPGYPLSSRLFFVGWFADRTRAAFHRGAGEDAVAALADAIELASDDDNLAGWHRGFTSVEVTTPLAASVIAGILKDRVEEPMAYPAFQELVRACLENLGARARGAEVTLDPAALDAAYVEKRRGRDGEAIDRMLTSYAIDYWLKDYYTGSPDLAVHAGNLVLRVALLRFLLFSHPGFDAADPARTLVEVTYKMSRAVEHDAAFAKNLDTILARLQITSLAHAVFLMKF
jgi:lysine-N-methylase